MEEIIINGFGFLYILLMIGIFCISLYINCFKYYFDVGDILERIVQIRKCRCLNKYSKDTGQYGVNISNRLESKRYAYE